MGRFAFFAAAALALVLMMASGRPAGALVDAWKPVAAAYVVAVDGQARWGRDADAPLPPASLTKLLSAVVLVDHPHWRADAVVTVSRRAAAMTGSRMGLKTGEKVRAGDLLAAMLVRSANDACLALAEHAAGSEAAFVARMNDTARSLGLAATAMRNPCGFDAPGHHSTARDLLHLSEVAMARPEIARAVALPQVEITTLDGRRVKLAATNQLIGRLDGVDGVKTGMTSKAGHCLIARAERAGRRVTVVLLGAEERWWTSAAMFQDAFDALAAGR